MSPIEVQQAAQFAKLHRIIASVRRMDKREAEAREHDKQARKHETALRDFADSIEYDNLYAVTLKACGGAQYLPS